MKTNPCKTCGKIPDHKNFCVIDRERVQTFKQAPCKITAQIKCCDCTVKSEWISEFFYPHLLNPMIAVWNELNPIEEGGV